MKKMKHAKYAKKVKGKTSSQVYELHEEVEFLTSAITKETLAVLPPSINESPCQIDLNIIVNPEEYYIETAFHFESGKVTKVKLNMYDDEDVRLFKNLYSKSSVFVKYTDLNGTANLVKCPNPISILAKNNGAKNIQPLAGNN